MYILYNYIIYIYRVHHDSPIDSIDDLPKTGVVFANPQPHLQATWERTWCQRHPRAPARPGLESYKAHLNGAKRQNGNGLEKLP